MCVANGECEININNRHVCSSCRLAKCFANGMQTELIRSRLSRRNVLNRSVNMTPTLNILTTTSQPNEVRLVSIQGLKVKIVVLLHLVSNN